MPHTDPDLSGSVATLDAVTLHRALALYLEALDRHRDELNSLNVYPVPDGDTGTNLFLTVEAVMIALGDEPRNRAVGGVRDAIARAALLAARGNSGVILSQVLRGFLESLAPDRPPTAAEVAGALAHAAEEAHRAVARPADGTVLSVLRDAGRAATHAARTPSAGHSEVIAAALDAARASLVRTAEINPELRQAGVVDAGAKGAVLLLDAMLSAVSGRPMSESIGPHGPVGRPKDEGVPRVDRYAYEVQYLLETDEQGMAGVRGSLDAIGESLVVVGGGGLYNVHVHTDQPGRAVEAGMEGGRPREISIVHLQDEVLDCRGAEARAVRLEETGGKACALVAVAEGAGLHRAFRSLGAHVVEGGPGNNPSVGDLIGAIEATAAPAVVVLPNHPNVVPAAERAAESSGKDVFVVPTRSIPAGLAAATTFNPERQVRGNVGEMTEAASACRSALLARARDGAETPAGEVPTVRPVRAGDWLAFVDDQPVGTGAIDLATSAVAERFSRDGHELVTIVVGRDATAEESSSVRAVLAATLPDVEIEVVEGGQPRYPFLIGAE